MGAVGVEAVKAYLRIEGDGEDALLAGLVATAEDIGERFTGQVFVARDVEQTLVAGPGWQRLAMRPVTAILGVAAVAADGAETVLPVGAYAVDIDAGGDGWVRVPGGPRRVAVRYRAGLAAAADGVPAPIAQGIVRLAGHLHAHRDAADEGPPPAAVAALWRPWRRMRLS